MVQFTEEFSSAPSDFSSEELEKGRRKSFFKAYRKTVGRCALLLLLLGVLANGISFGFSALFRAIQKSSGGLPLSYDMATFLIAYLPCLAADVIVILLGVLLLKPRFQDGILSKPKKDTKFLIFSFLGCLGAVNAAGLVFMLYYQLIHLLGGSFSSPQISLLSGDPLAMRFLLLYLCILGPVLEEIIFRGLILKSLEPFGQMSAIIASSLFFAMFHMNLVQLPTPFFMGLILGFVTIRTGSVFPAVVFHILNNTLRGALPLLMGGNTPLLNLMITMFTLLLYVIGGIGLILYLLRYGRSFTNLGRLENSGGITVGQKLSRTFLSVGGMLYLIFYLVMIVISFLV